MTRKFTAGDRLENGAKILERSGAVVLCSFGREFVTWRIDMDGHAYWGHYHKTVSAAVIDYEKRVSDGRFDR